MFDEPKEINDVYEQMDKLFKLRIRTQLKNTGLIFERFDSTDVITDEKMYQLTVNKKVFEFSSVKELYTGLLKVIASEEKEIKNQIDFLEHYKNEDLYPDVVSIDYELDALYTREYKLSKLIDKFNTM